MAGKYRLGIDVGGTFTDAMIINEETGEIRIGKVPSTPKDPSIGFLDAVDTILKENNIESPIIDRWFILLFNNGL